MLCKNCETEMTMVKEVLNGWSSYREYECTCGLKCVDSVFSLEWSDDIEEEVEY